MGIGPADIASWDFAGKYYDAPIHELIGTYRERLPTYASTYHADDDGGLDSPEVYADFAESSADRGLPGFKIHGWGGSDRARDIDPEIETVHAVGERVGDRMDLMLDPACEYATFGDALNVVGPATSRTSSGMRTHIETATFHSTATANSGSNWTRPSSRPSTSGVWNHSRTSSTPERPISSAPIPSTTARSPAR